MLSKYYASDDARHSFVTALFDASAAHYERFGECCRWDRSTLPAPVLERALRPGMKLLDVAPAPGAGPAPPSGSRGDGRGDRLDRSSMLRENRKGGAGPLVRGRAEALQFRDGAFDVLSMAMRCAT